MKEKYYVLFALIALFLSPFKTLAQQWLPVGPDDKTQLHPSYSYPQDLQFSNGTPYVFLYGQSSGNSTPFFFRKLNASSTVWETVSAYSVNDASSTTAMISTDGTPYLAYLNGITGSKICVKKYNQTAGTWDFVGKPDFTASSAKNEVLAVNGQDVYVAFSDGANVNKLTVMKLNADGINWDIVGNAGISVSTADNIGIQFLGTTIYVAFRDYGSNAAARVMKLDAGGTTWKNAGPTTASPGNVATISFVINNQTLYLAYTSDVLINNNVSVKKINASGTAWLDVASAPVPGIATNARLQFDQTQAYLTYADYANQHRCDVFKLNTAATAWTPVGNAGFSSGTASDFTLGFNNHKPYITFSDGGYLSKARAMKLNDAGTLWQDLVSVGFSATVPNFPNIVFNGSVPYVVYGEGIIPQNSTVMKWTGTQWQAVGSPQFTLNGGNTTQMPMIFKGGIPYVAYMDAGQSDKLSVKRLNAAGTGWEQVGTAGFAGGTTAGVNLVTDGTVIYAAAGTNILKLGAGDTWQSAGTLKTDAGETATNIFLAINNSTLYAAYVSSSGGIKVKKMNSAGGWDPVGGGLFSIANARYITLVFNNGLPYVCSSQALYKLNAAATGWNAVGSFSPSYGNLTYPTLAFEGSVPYISFSNAVFSLAGEVIRYDAASNTWKNVGEQNANIGAGDVLSSSLAIYNNQVFNVLSEHGAFVKVYGLSPVIGSFSPTTAASGAIVTIRGKNLMDISAVTFGGTAAKSYTAVSDSVMTAIVGTGASGSLAVTTAAGTASLAGFTYRTTPAISSATPLSARTGATVTISGTNLSGATAIAFGSMSAASFTVNSATSITAVVGRGTSGSITVTTPGGIASLPGFTFIPGAGILSFSPAAAKPGTTVVITGINFTGATAVTFGGIPATSFTVTSSSSISAVVGKGASGSITITTPNGTASLGGFTFTAAPVAPVITSFLPTEAAIGDTVIITGTGFNGVTSVTFGGNSAAAFFVRSSTVIAAVVGQGFSGSISVTTALGKTTLPGFTYKVDLPYNNFELAITSATCKGSANGMVTFTAAKPLNYVANLTGNGVNKSYLFGSSATIDSLAAGTYNVCITVSGVNNYSSCYTVVITEPKDLSVYSVVNSNNNTLNLRMSGGSQYNINLNGQLYTSTTDSTVTVPLAEGDNEVTVSTDRACQGMIEKLVTVSKMIPYPNPFQGPVNVNLGSKMIGKTTVEVHSLSNGKQVYFMQYTNRSGVLQVDLTGLENGIYAFHIVTDNSERVFKIIKK